MLEKIILYLKKIIVRENNLLKINIKFFPKTLFRYILSELLFSFFICFLFFFFIFFVNQILLMAKEVLEKQVPLHQVALLILYSLPTVISFSAPFACLVGTLMTIGRFTSDNEILVMLTSGFSYKTIFMPAVVLGLVISIVSFLVNDVLLPAGTVQLNKLMRQIAVTTPAVEMSANSVKRFRDTVIITGGVTGNILENVIILDRTQDGERRMILAKTAELKDGGKQGLSLNLEDSIIQSTKEIAREDYDYASMDLLQYWVSNEDIIQNPAPITAREMSSRDVHSSIKDKRIALDRRVNSRKMRLMTHTVNLENVLRGGPQSSNWNSKTNNIATLSRELQSLEAVKDDRTITIYVIELFRKFAVPFGAFCFVFLSVSLGLMAKKSGSTMGFIFGVIISAIYWSMLYVGQMLAVRVGTPPFWSMWLPNILCFSIGVVLSIIKVNK
ncbi:MAG: LptF/LptG family permease [Treponema sp.]|jgi:lipopolysaccharide export system permease protein|nr:LptF/LptG family permease [Treponema sp.]